MGDFELDTRLEPEAGRDGHFHAKISEDWAIWGPNGGYIAAIALRAAGLVAKVRRPASFSGHFLRVARFDEIDVEVVTLRAGRRSESLRVSIRQDDSLVFESLIRTAAAGSGLEHDVSKFPDVPDPDSLPDVEDLIDPEQPRYVFWNNFDARTLYPERFRAKPQAREPSWKEWYRFRPRATFDDPFVDAGRLLLIIDTMSWPAAVQPHPEPKFTAPNLDVATWFHAAEPESDWLLSDHDCPVAKNGLMGTHGRVWSRGGQLLATGGAQLFCVPMPQDG